ncbi:MAG TPA: adenylate/guanylate cyclase domain-containing protein [Prosthecobacter sp.]
MKLFSSFRAKLILTIFPVVACVTTGALMLSEWKFRDTYQQLFEEQFENQISAVTQARVRRLTALSSTLDTLAQSPAVVTAMSGKNFPQAGKELRPALESLSRERLLNEFSHLSRLSFGGPDDRRPSHDNRPPREPPRPPGGRQVPPFIALIDASGAVMTVPRQDGAMESASLGPPVPEATAPQTIFNLGDRAFEEVLRQQEVGYLLLRSPDSRAEQVREVFITPVRSPEDGRFLGAFAFGLPLTAMADKILYEQSRRSENGEIMGGIYVEGRLISSTVPADHKAAIEQAVASSLASSSKENREILVPIQGVSHRLIYRVLNPGSPFPQALQVNVYSLAPLQHEIADLRRGAIGLAVVVLAAGLALVVAVSRSLSGPVSQLVEAAQEIERGNYDVRVPVSKDEVGRLAHAFNDMAAGLALQDRYRSILHAVADRTVAERLMENSDVLGGELRNVSMLFCDIRGFTTLTEKMPPDEVVGLLNEHMTILTQVAYEHGGIVDKFVGDLIMVLFGAPLTTGDDARQAAECARAMLQARKVRNMHCRHPLEIGIGIATGTVVAGCMGSDQRLSYTVIGHRVNLASRLCHVAQPGEIVVDAETAQKLAVSTALTALPSLQLKGISEPVEAYRLCAA